MLLYNEQKPDYKMIKMNSLKDLPNIGVTLADKLKMTGILNEEDLKEIGSENTRIKIATI